MASSPEARPVSDTDILFSPEMMLVFANLCNLSNTAVVEQAIQNARADGLDVYSEFNATGILTPFMCFFTGYNFPEELLRGLLNAATADDMLHVSPATGYSVLDAVVNSGNRSLNWNMNMERNVRMLLSHPAANNLLDLADNARDTPLRIAAMRGGLGNILHLLLNAGANFRAVDRLGDTAFRIACYYEDVNSAQILLDKDTSQLDTRDRDQQTALYAASLRGQFRMVQFLIEWGANIFLAADEERGGITPLDVAYRFDHVAVVALILASYAKQLVQREGIFAVHSVLHGATYSDWPQRGPMDIMKTPCGPLTAQALAFLFRIPAMAAKVGDYDYNGSLPLHVACQVGAPIEVLQVLRDIYPQALFIQNNNGDLPLHLLCHNTAPTATIRWMLVAMAEHMPLEVGLQTKNLNGDLPMHIACKVQSQFESIQLLVQEFGGALQTRNGGGDLPLHICCRGDAAFATIRLLAQEFGGALQIRNGCGDLPLQICCRENAALATIRLLAQQYPYALDIPDRNGLFPLHLHLSVTSDAEAIDFWENLIPEALERRTRGGKLPFQVVAFENSASVCVLFDILKGHPDALMERNII